MALPDKSLVKTPRVMMLGLRGIPNVQGGVEKHVEALSVHFVEQGWDVEVLGRKPYLPKKTAYSWCGVRITPIWAPTSMKFEAIAHTFLGVLRAAFSRPDIVHIHAIGPALMAPVARLFGLKLVVTHHGFDYNRQKWGKFARTMLKLGEWAGMRFANGRIGVSNDIARTMHKRYHVPVTFIPNGVAPVDAEADPQLLLKHGLTARGYVVMVARIVPEKRQLDLVKAFALLDDPTLKLVLVGSAEYADTYAAEVRREAAYSPNVVLTGALQGEELATVFGQAALFVLPSSHEGMPIALLEAMAHGLPVLASDITANLEVGLAQDDYFPLGDINALAASIERKLQVPFSPEDAAVCSARIRRDYSWRSVAMRTLDIYDAVRNGTAKQK